MRRQIDLGAAHVASRRKFVELAKNRVVSVHVDEENNQVYHAALPDELVQVRRVHSEGVKEVVALREELDDATAHTFSPAYTPGPPFDC
jgi:stress response protein YsnF